MKRKDWRDLEWRMRRRMEARAVVIGGRAIRFNFGCRSVDPRDLSERDYGALERSHGWPIRRPWPQGATS